VSRYLIFVIAGFLGIVGVLIIWIWEPQDQQTTTIKSIVGTSDSFVQETWLIYPVNYFAAKLISFDGENKIYGLGWPVWSNQQLSWSTLWNSIDNIIQYNGVILPRQISRSAWVPKFTQERYSEWMVKLFLEGMSSSQTDTSSIQYLMSKSNKQLLSGSILDTFKLGCTDRRLFTTQFCDLKLQDSILMWDLYDLSTVWQELDIIADYVFSKSTNKDNQTTFCNAMLKQYRYSWSPLISRNMQWCSEETTNEVTYISYMISVNEEVRTNQFTNKVYNNASINQYKLMSRYQYLMYKIKWAEYIEAQDDEILRTYGSYITQLVDRTEITQPYGDIITIFHQAYLLPWLNEREAYSSASQKDITNWLIYVSNLIINGDESQWITSVASGSRLQSVDFLKSQGIYDENNTYVDKIADNPAPEQPSIVTSDVATINTTSTRTWSTTPTPTPTVSAKDTLNALIATVLNVEPTSVNQRGSIVIIQYPYKWMSWFVAVDLVKKWETQIYFDSPDSGATKITHPQVIFNSSNKELIMAIMDNYLGSNPSVK